MVRGGQGLDEAEAALTGHRSFSDSPWFWSYLFATAALIGLALIGPKFAARQSQIERQFEGRQRATQPAPESTEAAAENHPTRITLQPLFFGLAIVTILVWLIHWRTTLRPQSLNPEP